MEPWNTGYFMAGDVTKKLNLYSPFRDGSRHLARSYATMSIDYKETSMNLDLLDRKGKYSDGFCGWTQLP